MRITKIDAPVTVKCNNVLSRGLRTDYLIFLPPPFGKLHSHPMRDIKPRGCYTLNIRLFKRHIMNFDEIVAVALELSLGDQRHSHNLIKIHKISPVSVPFSDYNTTAS